MSQIYDIPAESFQIQDENENTHKSYKNDFKDYVTPNVLLASNPICSKVFVGPILSPEAVMKSSKWSDYKENKRVLCSRTSVFPSQCSSVSPVKVDLDLETSQIVEYIRASEPSTFSPSLLTKGNKTLLTTDEHGASIPSVVNIPRDKSNKEKNEKTLNKFIQNKKNRVEGFHNDPDIMNIGSYNREYELSSPDAFSENNDNFYGEVPFDAFFTKYNLPEAFVPVNIMPMGRKLLPNTLKLDLVALSGLVSKINDFPPFLNQSGINNIGTEIDSHDIGRSSDQLLEKKLVDILDCEISGEFPESPILEKLQQQLKAKRTKLKWYHCPLFYLLGIDPTGYYDLVERAEYIKRYPYSSLLKSTWILGNDDDPNDDDQDSEENYCYNDEGNTRNNSRERDIFQHTFEFGEV
ncbi:uncharacterized protein SCDLUD_001687 [Saccharomycodes ludwigii]|uniref:uncharacterized protein n=1 Tax=Saccharomycodes ludwigii TaxID=36035 RepID=UPI001E885A1D|nr:hypothetical protein SCDLUD_001687 [Saccharomycodes ludwigii]KAH3901903.1 hypothetical protein SCDLUD_001687 [Saccharomycodes ludwigii]